MKRVRISTENDEGDDFYQIEEFAFRECSNMPLAIFLRIQFNKGLITEEEFFEILGMDEEKVKDGIYSIINW